MAGIAEMFGGSLNRVAKFEEQVEGLNKEQTRKLEVTLLKPEPMQDTSCPPATAKGIVDSKVVFYIPPKRYRRIFNKFFKTSRMGERNNGDGVAKGETSVRDINIFLALLDALITQKLVYDPETKKLNIGLSLQVQDAITKLRTNLDQAAIAAGQDAPGVAECIIADVHEFLNLLEGTDAKGRPQGDGSAHDSDRRRLPKNQSS